MANTRKQRGPGTSRFTHRDDAQASLHTTHLAHHEALHWGGEEPDHNDREAVILGPPAFGSPDPATLGHRMNPQEGHPSSAPALDPGFHEIQGTAHVTHYTDEEIYGMSKQELLELARENDVPVRSNMSRDEILDALGYDEDEDEGEEDGDEEDEGENGEDNSATEQSPSGFGQS